MKYTKYSQYVYLFAFAIFTIFAIDKIITNHENKFFNLIPPFAALIMFFLRRYMYNKHYKK